MYRCPGWLAAYLRRSVLRQVPDRVFRRTQAAVGARRCKVVVAFGATEARGDIRSRRGSSRRERQEPRGRRHGGREPRVWSQLELKNEQLPSLEQHGTQTQVLVDIVSELGLDVSECGPLSSPGKTVYAFVHAETDLDEEVCRQPRPPLPRSPVVRPKQTHDHAPSRTPPSSRLPLSTVPAWDRPPRNVRVGTLARPLGASMPGQGTPPRTCLQASLRIRAQAANAVGRASCAARYRVEGDHTRIAGVGEPLAGEAGAACGGSGRGHFAAAEARSDQTLGQSMG